MNTAIRILNEMGLPSSWVRIFLAKRSCFFGLLWAVVITSALAVVYMSNQCRLATINLQKAQAQETALQTEYGQLLLEKATWSTQMRVHQVAAEKLQMLAPAHVVTIHE